MVNEHLKAIKLKCPHSKMSIVFFLAYSFKWNLVWMHFSVKLQFEAICCHYFWHEEWNSAVLRHSFLSVWSFLFVHLSSITPQHLFKTHLRRVCLRQQVCFDWLLQSKKSSYNLKVFFYILEPLSHTGSHSKTHMSVWHEIHTRLSK